MKMRFVTVVATAALLAACSSSPEDGGATSTGGATTGQTGTTTTTAPGVAPGSVQEFVQTVGNVAFFDFDMYNVRSDAQAALAAQAAWLKRYPNYSITLEGNCDERGTREYNLALGERRANSAKEFLVSQGVDAARIEVVSYGKERPTCVESTEACYQRNRNATTVLR